MLLSREMFLAKVRLFDYQNPLRRKKDLCLDISAHVGHKDNGGQVAFTKLKVDLWILIAPLKTVKLSLLFFVL